MKEEVSCFLRHMESAKTVKKAHLTFVQGSLNGREVVATISGIGKVNAAVSTQVMIDFFDVKSIICTGVAGGLDPALEIGDVVISRDLVQHDVDVTAFGYEPGFIPRLGIKNFPADGELIRKAYEAGNALLKENKVITGRILSGDTFISSPERKVWLFETFGGSCVEMEGGAVAQVCYLNKVPFVVIRSISDGADGVAAIDYRGFVRKAASNSFLLINGVLGKFD